MMGLGVQSRGGRKKKKKNCHVAGRRMCFKISLAESNGKQNLGWGRGGGKGVEGESRRRERTYLGGGEREKGSGGHMSIV